MLTVYSEDHRLHHARPRLTVGSGTSFVDWPKVPRRTRGVAATLIHGPPRRWR